MTGPPASSRALRRYPALTLLAVAALSASLLPAAFHVPQSGPTSSAMLAPVPGEGRGSGDLAALGAATSDGLGSSAGGAPGSAQGADSDAVGADAGDGGDGGRGANPANRRCVGKPARQTEDPMSPTCVSYFKGDNGGATWNGVTPTEIRVAIFQACETGSFETEIIDYGDPARSASEPAALVRYFNNRFETFGRRVHLFSVKFNCDTPPATQVQLVREKVGPFYLINIDLLYGRWRSMTPAMVAEAARLKMMASVPYTTQASAAEHAPYAVSYVPHLDIHIANAVEALCARLAGRPARFAGDPTYHGRTRKFGLFYWQDGDPDNYGGHLLVRRVKERCGDIAGDVVVGYIGPSDYNEPINRLRLAGVTTVVVMNDTNFIPLVVADQHKWYPEWFFPSDMAGKSAYRTVPLPVAKASFGLMGYRRLGRVSEQHHLQAYAEACPDCSEPPVTDLLYEELMMLFTGVQAAGPRLTPQGFDRGMRALPRRQSVDPFAPSAYFAPGDHSYAKDYAFVWWDPAGRPPGESTPGCWRLLEDGLRYRAEDWAKRPGDEGIQQSDPEQPCQGERK